MVLSYLTSSSLSLAFPPLLPLSSSQLPPNLTFSTTLQIQKYCDYHLPHFEPIISVGSSSHIRVYISPLSLLLILIIPFPPPPRLLHLLLSTLSQIQKYRDCLVPPSSSPLSVWALPLHLQQHLRLHFTMESLLCGMPVMVVFYLTLSLSACVYLCQYVSVCACVL